MKYYMAGSCGLKWSVPDVSLGDTIRCDKEKTHEIAAGLIAPADICLDIGPGIRPQRLLPCNTHVLVEPYGAYCDELVKRYPQKLTVKMDGLAFLLLMQSKSVDTIFMIDVIEHLNKDDGKRMLAEARRVARKQIVVFTPLGFMPRHYSEVGDIWGDIQHNELQNHLSGWLPEEFPGSTIVLTEDYHVQDGNVNGAFYAIISCAETDVQAFADNKLSLGRSDGKLPLGRLVIVSEPTTDFVFKENDLIIADISLMELSHVITNVPKRNCLYVPLALTAAHADVPIEVLRSTILNFQMLEGYVSTIKNRVAIGVAALMVMERIAGSLAYVKK
ncbi:MAG: class I SAM-dependent methyltransferase [Alphaproteobacteria bacterium]|nr:class I SAM-dependent methyltransferase [Alphaproteobacteria bacterium]